MRPLTTRASLCEDPSGEEEEEGEEAGGKGGRGVWVSGCMIREGGRRGGRGGGRKGSMGEWVNHNVWSIHPPSLPPSLPARK